MPAYGDIDKALPGLLFGTEHNVISGPAAVEIAFGSPVYQAEGEENKLYAVAAAGRHLRGVAIFTQLEAASTSGIVGTPGNGTASYKVGDAVNVLVDGEIWVPVADAIVAHKPAYLTAAGVWTDEASGNVLTPYIFRTGSTGAGLVRLGVNKVGMAVVA